jgi:hypothetical protein
LRKDESGWRIRGSRGTISAANGDFIINLASYRMRKHWRAVVEMLSAFTVVLSEPDGTLLFSRLPVGAVEIAALCKAIGVRQRDREGARATRRRRVNHTFPQLPESSP